MQSHTSGSILINTHKFEKTNLRELNGIGYQKILNLTLLKAVTGETFPSMLVTNNKYIIYILFIEAVILYSSSSFYSQHST